MFSGIVSELGTVVSNEVSTSGSSAKLTMKAAMYASSEDSLKVGDSVLHNGVCLTITNFVSREAAHGSVDFDIGSETLRATNLSNLSAGDLVNLERSKRLGDSLDGHLVLGHVDGVARVSEIRQEEETWRLEFEVSSDIAPYVAEKGSITIDGVSLTVGEVRDAGEFSFFVVYIIPHTWEMTVFNTYVSGSTANIEIDVLARYAARVLDYSARVSAANSNV